MLAHMIFEDLFRGKLFISIRGYTRRRVKCFSQQIQESRERGGGGVFRFGSPDVLSIKNATLT